MTARAQPAHGMDRPRLDYTGLFDASPNPYLVLDRSLTIVGANQAYLAATKRKLEDIVGRWAWDAFPTDPETLRQSIASFERVLRTGRPDTVAVLRFDIPRPEAEGGGFEERYWSITHTPVLDGNGEVSLVLLHPIDVTELQRLRDAARYAGEERRIQLVPMQSSILGRARAVQEVNLSLRAEGERLRALFQQAPGFMCMLRGPEHRIELANAAYLQLVGHRDVVGKPVRDALPETEDQGFIALLDRVYATGEPFVGCGAEFIVQAGPDSAPEQHFLDFVYQPITDDETGRVSGIFIAGSDVTERTRAEAALRHANETLEARVAERTAELIQVADALHAAAEERAQVEEALRQSQKMETVGQLTGGIAHDFNNMLQAVGGSLDMLQRRVAQGRTADADRYAEGARKTLDRAAALTHRLLAFARRQTLQPKLVEPDELIGGMAELVRRTVGPAIAVELHLNDGIWNVLCDPSQLENALLNVIINARDAMPEGGRLTIRTADLRLTAADVVGQDEAGPGDYVEVSVADTGTGMDEATRARAFEPFFTTKPIGQGTGLGLSQLYGFVRQSGGIVRLHSAPGRGTAVRLYLPRHGAANGTGQDGPGAASDAPQAAAGEVVLLVEDEADVRTAVAEHLRDLGYRVLEAGDGPAALRLLRGVPRVDLLVSDVGLPGGLNGRQVADAARERQPGLPVLFITGYAGTFLDGQLAPDMAVIGKPFALDALAAKARAMLEAAPVN